MIPDCRHVVSDIAGILHAYLVPDETVTAGIFGPPPYTIWSTSVRSGSNMTAFDFTGRESHFDPLGKNHKILITLLHFHKNIAKHFDTGSNSPFQALQHGLKWHMKWIKTFTFSQKIKMIKFSKFKNIVWFEMTEISILVSISRF